MILDRAETMSVDERTALQIERLRALIDRLLSVGGVQAGRLRAAGVTGGGDLTLDDLPRLPTIGKQDLWDNYPFGLVAVPMSDVVCVHGSSGTSGRPTLVAYTANDLKLWARMMARSLAGVGAARDTIVHNAYGYGLFTGGLGVHHGAIELGATVVPMSGGMTERQLRLIQDLRPTVLTCTPSYAIYLGEAFAAEGITPDQISLKVGVHGAEPWTESMRAEIERLLGVRALDIYGLSEIIGPGVACETPASTGWLHVQEDHFYAEVVDPLTGAPVPDGEPGELTFTTFTKEALPLLRYRTGDIARLDRTPSGDGRTSVKMSKITGRRDDMIIIRGVNVYPSEVEAVVLADPAVAPQYVLVIDEREPMKRLIVCVEAVAPEVNSESTGTRLAHALHERLGLHCDLRVLEPGSLPRTEVGKAKRVLYWRDAAPPLPGLA